MVGKGCPSSDPSPGMCTCNQCRGERENFYLTHFPTNFVNGDIRTGFVVTTRTDDVYSSSVGRKSGRRMCRYVSWSRLYRRYSSQYEVLCYPMCLLEKFSENLIDSLVEFHYRVTSQVCDIHSIGAGNIVTWPWIECMSQAWVLTSYLWRYWLKNLRRFILLESLANQSHLPKLYPN